jgi:hypothetical protein
VILKIIIKKITCLYFFAVSLSAIAQFGSQQIIDDQADLVTMVRTGDLDGDGNIDVVASVFDKVFWYKNLDGFGNFGIPQEIGLGGLSLTLSVHLADLDMDNDMDVIATSFDNNLVSWYRNSDGLGNFSSANLITSNDVMGIIDVIAADFDGDLDSDLVVLSDDSNDLVIWYENLNGNGDFGPKQIITATATNGRAIYVADIDGDNDMDVITSAPGSITMVWFENLDGNGTFSLEKVIASGTASVEEIYAKDLDGDDDLDIIAASPFEDKVSWHENLDGLGNFGTQRIITTDAGFPRSVYSVDLDNDGDNDVLSAGSDFTDGKIAWYENLDGLGNFGALQMIQSDSDASRSVYAADLDNDGDQDVLAGLRVDDKVTWYENSTILGTDENRAGAVSIYPNPVSNFLFVSNSDSIESITIYDALGRILFLKEGDTSQIDLSFLQSGLLFIEVKTQESKMVVKIIKE